MAGRNPAVETLFFSPSKTREATRLLPSRLSVLLWQVANRGLIVLRIGRFIDH